MPDDLHSPDSNTVAPQHHASKQNLRNSINSSKITWKTYDDLKVEPQSWLIQGLIPADSLVMLYGARGQGKTFLALDIAASVASGRAWLGCPVVQKGKVCYLLAERPEGIARRMAGWLQHTGATPDEIQNVFVADAGAIKIDDDDGVNKIVASIHSELKIGSTLLDARSGQTPPPAADCLQLLVIDPMAAYMRGAENDAGETTKFMHCARRISAHFGCSVLFVHHEGKGNYNNSLGARGSSAIEAALDTILYLEPDKDDETLSVLSMTKQRDFKEFPDMWLKFEGRVGVPQGNGHTTEIMDLGKYPVMAAKP
jgi:putative DNA primase/helicase